MSNAIFRWDSRKRRSAQPRGIILLVVLGMLTLFSVLGVSYLVFTSRHRAAATNISRSETSRIDTKQLVDEALKKLLVGSDGPDSSLWGHDLLGDLYGMRDSVEGYVTPVNLYSGNNIDCAPDVLLGNQFLRFPSQLHVEDVAAFLPARLPYQRRDAQVERRYPGYGGAVPQSVRFPVDDMLNGRLLTFTDGPLKNLTFRIVRSFGDHRNPTDVAGNPGLPGRETLSGQVVLDLRDHFQTSVEIDGESKTIQDWLATAGFSPHRFIYDGVVTQASLGGATPTAYSSFYINGRILNGPGLGWDRPRTAINTASGPNFNLNERVATTLNVTNLKDELAAFTPGPEDFPFHNSPFELGGAASMAAVDDVDMPVAYQGHFGLHRLPPDFTPLNQYQAFVTDLPPGDTDEPYDAADYNNLWLSYFPNDPLLGDPTPSFVRPALLNWIINQQGGTTLSSLEVPRLRSILYALQRSTLRPLPFSGDPVVPNSISNRSPGVLQLEYSGFTGGNGSDGLNQPINILSTDPVYLANRVVSVARALAGEDTDGDGIIDSWDVDNDGDGVNDSLWIDAGLPLSQDPSGRLFKPMVSYMVEDLGGRVNANRAGNLAQARPAVAPLAPARGLINTTISGAIQHEMPVLAPANTANKSPIPGGNVISVVDAPTGFGYGPAEIDLRPLFGTNFAPTNIADQLRFGPQRLLGERLGTWSTAAGRVAASTLLAPNIYIAAGELEDQLTVRGNDWFGAIRDPLRANLHNFRESQGIPMDAFGRMTIGLDLGGGLAIGRGAAAVANAGVEAGDTDDDPYEFMADANTDPDAPYTYSELETLLRFDSFDRDLIASRLIELINDYHSQIPNNRAQLDQVSQLKKLLADSITTHSNSAAIATGILPPEWRNASAPLTDLRSGFTTIAGTAAATPQQLFLESLDQTALAAIPAPQRDQVRNAWLWELLPLELRAGDRLNLNRPFGNGVNDDDDNRDGVSATFRLNTAIPDPPSDVRPFADVIDDPQEVRDGGVVNSGLGERHLRFDSNNGPADSLWTSSRGDVTPGEPGFNSRESYARHLYVLAMFLTQDANTNTDFEFPFDNTNPPPFVNLPAGTGANPNPNAGLTFEQEYRAWKIAQWAVNVADYRDPDGIMTQFRYDPDPSDGWDVYDIQVGANTVPTYRTVWGLEYPELTLEESLAFHDRRVRDTDRDPSTGRCITPAGNRGPDMTADQYQIPVGSLFLELRNTRSPQPVRLTNLDTDTTANPMAFPAELYRNIGRVDNPVWVLDIAAEAPDNNPVWRVAITGFHDNATLPTTSPDFLLQPVGADPVNNFAGLPLDRDTTTLDPLRPQFFDNPLPTSPIDRVVWFTGRDPDPDDNGYVNFASNANRDYLAPQSPLNPNPMVPTDSRVAGRIFYNRTPNRFLAPGQIMVVGPRPDTPIGTAYYSTAGVRAIDDDGVPQVNPDEFAAQQFVSLSTESVIIRDRTTGNPVSPTYDSNGGAVNNASARPILSVVAQSNPPTVWNDPDTRDRTIGLNISEPYEVTAAAVAADPTLVARNYYREPTERLSDRTNGGFVYGWDTWHNFDSGNGQLPDEPFDSLPGSELFDTLNILGQQTGTHLHYKTAYLQRLADPTRPFHPQDNPYISVDYITLDLTVFNGSQDNNDSGTDAMGMAIWPDPADEDPYVNPPLERFGSRYKTGMPIHMDIMTTTAANPPANLTHSVSTFAPDDTAAQLPGVLPPPPPNSALDYFFVELNVGVDVNVDPTRRQFHSTSLGWTNQSYGRRWQQTGGATALMTPFVGLPIDPWLSNVTWLNRNFVSPEELMWVPTSAPGRLGFEFATASVEAGFPAAPPDPYDDTTNGAFPSAPDQQRRVDFNQRFTHLFNYFSGKSNSFTGANASPNLWRLLEWVEVPPPFDADVDFISPELDVLTTVENSALPPAFVYPTFLNAAAPNAYLDGDPRTWTFASPLPASSRTYNVNSGTWGPAPIPGSGRTNGFWTNHVSVDPFRPPFCFQDKTFRNGLINLNTIKNLQVYRALMHGFSNDTERNAATGAFQTEFLDSRRGYALPLPALPLGSPIVRLRPNLNEATPTQLDGVFKPSNSSDVRPQISGLAAREPLATTRLRPDPATPTKPLFQRPSPGVEPLSQERSVVHNQLGQTRLANLASEQSNVFAVWVTVGLFEVDGTTLGVRQELGSDTGNVRRAKGFFIIDRSVPAMYRPGEVNNAMNTVQLYRVID